MEILAAEKIYCLAVGDIHDEYDQAATSQAHAVRTGAPFEVDGLLNLEDFEDETGVMLPEGPYETAAGFVLERLGRLAVVGDVVPINGHDLVVTAVDRRRIRRLEVREVGRGEDSTGEGSG